LKNAEFRHCEERFCDEAIFSLLKFRKARLIRFARNDLLSSFFNSLLGSVVRPRCIIRRRFDRLLPLALVLVVIQAVYPLQAGITVALVLQPVALLKLLIPKNLEPGAGGAAGPDRQDGTGQEEKRRFPTKPEIPGKESMASRHCEEFTTKQVSDAGDSDLLWL
jgi:hypothetical protein